MEKTKEQILADLYALRGGLSLISKHTDKITALEATIQHNTEKKDLGRRVCGEMEYEVSKRVEKVQTLKKDNENSLSAIEKIRSSKATEYKRAEVEFLMHRSNRTDYIKNTRKKSSCNKILVYGK